MTTTTSLRSVRAWVLVGAVASLGLVAALTGCTPGSEITVAEADVVATMHDPNFDFGAVQTYALADTIVHVTGDPSEPDSPLLSRDRPGGRRSRSRSASDWRGHAGSKPRLTGRGTWNQ